jgi:hypothetical protein
MFSKSSVFAVVALVAFVSLGVLLFPQVGQAQCIWDCDLGCTLDPNTFQCVTNTSGFSPGDFSIDFCFDSLCAKDLTDSNGNLIFTGVIPAALVRQTLSGSCTTLNAPTTTNVTIGGTVVVVLRNNKTQKILPQSAAEATLNLVVEGATLDCSSFNIISKTTGVNIPRTNVFAAASQIKILQTPQLNAGNSSLTAIGWGGPGCPTNPDGTLSGDCFFPLGTVEFTNGTLSKDLPATGTLLTDFSLGEVYRAVGSGASPHFVGARVCKGAANSGPSTIGCSTGGFIANAVWGFAASWVSNFNPGSANSQVDIISADFFTDIVASTVSARLVDSNESPTSPEAFATSCFLHASNSALRCNFNARDFGLTSCPSPIPPSTIPVVDVQVRGVFSHTLTGTSQNFKADALVTCTGQ